MGTAFNEDMELIQFLDADKKDIKKYQKSKYVQANSISLYKQIEEAIENGKTIYYFGTPCQVAAIKLYFKQDINNFYLIELLCHGVGSPGVFKEFVETLGSDLVDYHFRSKMVDTNFFIGKEIYRNGKCNIYTKGFLNDLYLRESCYECEYRGEKRVGDITIGDAWGIADGQSVIIVNTAKGEKIVNDICDKVILQEIDYSLVKESNRALSEEKKSKKAKKEFVEIWQNEKVEKAISTCLPKLSFKGQIAYIIEKLKWYMKYIITKG